MALPSFLKLFLFITLTGFPISYLIEEFGPKAGRPLFYVAAPVCIATVPLAYQFLIKDLPPQRKKTLFLHVFAFFAWATIPDFVLFLTIFHIPSWIRLDGYLAYGERYLNSCYGGFSNLHDSTVHMLLYLYFFHTFSNHDPDVATHLLRIPGLFWVGSMVNSLTVLLGGALSGVTGSQIHPSTLLNVPFVILPAYFGKHFLIATHDPPLPATSTISKSKSKDSLSFLDPFLIVTTLAVIVVMCIRFLASLGSDFPVASAYSEMDVTLSDPNGFPRVQALVHFFYYIPFLIAFLWNVVSPTSSPAVLHTLTDLAFALTGASVQSV